MWATKLESSRFTRSGDAARARSNTDANPGSAVDQRGAICTYQVGAVNMSSRVRVAFSPVRVRPSRLSSNGRKASAPASRWEHAENVTSCPRAAWIPAMKCSSKVVLPAPGSPVRHTMRTSPAPTASRFSCRIRSSSSRRRKGPCSDRKAAGGGAGAALSSSACRNAISVERDGPPAVAAYRSRSDRHASISSL